MQRSVLRQHAATDLVSCGHGKGNTCITYNIKLKLKLNIKLNYQTVWVDCPFFRVSYHKKFSVKQKLMY